jgi:AraC family transcriptional regulator
MSESQPFEFRSPHGVRKVEHRSRCWNRITVRHVVQHLDAGRVWHDISAPELTVAMVLEQSGGYCEPRFNVNRPTPRDRFDAGHTVFVPPDMTIWGYSDSIRRTRDLRLSFPSALLESILGEDFDPTKAATPILALYDDRITRCANLLADEISESTGGNLYGESLTMAMTALLVSSRRNSSRQLRGGLARWRLRRALEFFEANLSQDIRLEEVANLVGLSQSQFARAFRVSMSKPPYQWLLDARIRRAREMLLDNRTPVAEIAIRAGFADQSHLTKVFHRITGATPAQWKNSR